MTERIDNAIALYDAHVIEYKAIFGDDAVWCRAIPRIQAVVVK